ncbi:DUF1697 domain-containing protein [Micromonospora chokoriensis]|uniref:Uncharacterized conserved protein, DUF1697 family n=1 Tax=Micromonospora chokoriensis TaxID=356851 RepID=A0A1C4U6W0_9ACTN|nr:DUF1697 domain-containing protein [Micromonospora chokoriensis]SCE67453.1 Uncharacterized conserved protein, DUF1697 family [Micromonospora chokoriensis]
MTRYVALLRGVNVGGATRLAMADLRRIVTGLGHEDVKTYLQSGNVAFSSTVRDAEELAAGIRQALTDEVALTVPVLVRSGRELAAIAGGNPYADREDDPTRLMVAFLATAPEKSTADALSVPGGENVSFTVTGREVFLHYVDGGYGRSKFTNAYLEKKLGVVATTRNWKSVRALAELAAG